MLFLKRAVQDILRNRLLNIVTVVTIALSVLIVCTFALFLINTEDVIRSWEKGIRMMVYLKPETGEALRNEIEEKLLRFYGVLEVRFISKAQALETFRSQMKHQQSLIDGLKKNPLPDAFEIRLVSVSQSDSDIETLAAKIEALPGVAEIEYGRQWLGKVIHFFQLFRLVAIAMGGLFFMAAVSIVANTIRLVLYSRQTEIEIMRLVGATDLFIKIPFYFQAIIQGLMGAFVGLVVLGAIYILISTNMQQGLYAVFFQIRFFPLHAILLVTVCSMLVGWIGCYLSLKQFLKT